MLMFVLIMMNEVRKPEMWSWMWGNVRTDSKHPAAKELAAAKPIDTRAGSEKEKLGGDIPVDAFRASKPARNPLVAESLVGDSREYLSGITSDLFAAVEDNSVLRVAENDAWQTVLGVLKQTPQDVIEATSVGYVSFAQLFRQTDSYRGRVVEIRGTVRRSEEIPTRENPHGIERLFRWIVEPAGPSNAPIVVYSLEKPENLGIGADAREDARFFGICFKRWTYAAGDGTRIAPLILAKTVNWQPRPAPQLVEVPSWPATTATLAGLATLAVVVSMLVYRSTVRKHADVERARGYLSRGVDQLNDADVLPPVEQSLRELENAEQQISDG